MIKIATAIARVVAPTASISLILTGTWLMISTMCRVSAVMAMYNKNLTGMWFVLK